MNSGHQVGNRQELAESLSRRQTQQRVCQADTVNAHSRQYCRLGSIVLFSRISLLSVYILRVSELRQYELLDTEQRHSWDIPTDNPLPQLGIGGEFLRFRRKRHELRRTPQGAGQPVLVLPGFLTSDSSTLVLRRHLKKLGFNAKGWKRGTNFGFVKAQLPIFSRLVKKLADEEGRAVHLVGSSLGGFLAREVARDCPQEVAQVISIGSPIVGGPKYTRAARFYRRAGINLDKIEAAVDARNAVPIEVPLTLIYSKCDGVVAWQACIDTQHDHAEHVEINIPHSCMGVSPQVFRVVSEKLGALP